MDFTVTPTVLCAQPISYACPDLVLVSLPPSIVWSLFSWTCVTSIAAMVAVAGVLFPVVDVVVQQL